MSLKDQQSIFLKKMSLSKTTIILLFIVCIGFIVRIFGLNWDNFGHMHPDERAITLFALPLHFPSSLKEFFLPSSPLNTHFFAYGNFPIYFLKLISAVGGIFNPIISQYDGMNLIGRAFSALFDTGTIVVLFFTGKKIFNEFVGILAAFFYSISVLAIQTSHFYVVDTPLTFFITLTLFLLLKFYTHPSKKKSVLIGIFFGTGVATKNSALALLAPILITITIDFLLVFLKSPHKISIWAPHIPKIIKSLATDAAIIAGLGFLIFLFWEPYFLIDSINFWAQTQQQFQMTHDAFTFPYTLQYVGKIPFGYELKNIFLWGQGPMIAIISFVGIIYGTWIAFFKDKSAKWAQELIVVTFFWSYFFVVGRFAIGFMRYMLPIYPILCLFGGLILWESMRTLFIHFKSKLFIIPLFVIVFIMFLLWPIAFLQIYSKPNTRISASKWINDVISAGATLSIEHWDDSLPLSGQEKYNMQTLTLYDPDAPEKWQTINAQLSKTDYIIIASNRLYVPLQKLTNCEKLPPGRCYPQTAGYYKKLFSGDLNFSKVAEFSVYPTIPFINLPIDDQSADESFTVYDHPKIMIFQKNTY